MTKSNHDPCTFLKYDLVWNFLCPYRLSIYFAEWNNTLAICCSVKRIIRNKIKTSISDMQTSMLTLMNDLYTKYYSDNNS